MNYNNKGFGKTNVITDSIYNSFHGGFGSNPPVGSFLLVADDGEQLANDIDRSFITDGGA